MIINIHFFFISTNDKSRLLHSPIGFKLGNRYFSSFGDRATHTTGTNSKFCALKLQMHSSREQI